MSKGYKIFIDLDGVLSNFSKKVAELMDIPLLEGEEVSNHPDFNKKWMWHCINQYDEHTPFFYSLEIIPDAYLLWDFVTDKFDRDDIAILTASGSTPSDAAMQKKRWIRKHFGSYTTHVVTKSSDKAVYASSTSILIDDREKSIIPFREAGGIGILHTSAKDTIEQLKDILEA